MAYRPLPSQDVLRQLLDYDPATGLLIWRHRDVSWFEPSPARTAEHISNLWNVRYAGTDALASIDSNGYKNGRILGDLHRAHRIIWKMETGSDPDQIDHINGNRVDNRFENLREVSSAENTRNHKRRSDNTTGVTGVYWYPHNRKVPVWLVRAGPKHIGSFRCFGKAVRARRAAEKAHGFHENHGRAI